MWNARLKRHSLACALVVSIGGCHRSSDPADRRPRAFVYVERLGLARWHENRGCLAVFNSSIAPRTRAALVNQPESTDPPHVTMALVGRHLPQACDVGLSFPNRHGVSPSFYEIAIADGASPSDGVVFVVLDPPRPPVVRAGHVDADLDGDGRLESFRVCKSSENLHFMVWTGSPAQGQPRWHGTYYVGYDMTPSCTDEDVAGMVILDKR